MITPERYLNAKEAAKLLGMPLNTLYKKVTEIPHVKQGKRHVFKEARFVSGWTTASIEGAGRAEGSHHAARAAAPLWK